MIWKTRSGPGKEGGQPHVACSCGSKTKSRATCGEFLYTQRRFICQKMCSSVALVIGITGRDCFSPSRDITSSREASLQQSTTSLQQFDLDLNEFCRYQDDSDGCLWSRYLTSQSSTPRTSLPRCRQDGQPLSETATASRTCLIDRTDYWRNEFCTPLISGPHGQPSITFRFVSNQHFHGSVVDHVDLFPLSQVQMSVLRSIPHSLWPMKGAATCGAGSENRDASSFVTDVTSKAPFGTRSLRRDSFAAVPRVNTFHLGSKFRPKGHRRRSFNRIASCSPKSVRKESAKDIGTDQKAAL
jgi:hypothetical protein